jgi:sugar/nucleoside kinase (ribokinase family)
MPGFIVVQERDEPGLAVLDARNVGDEPGAKELLDQVRDGPIGVAANAGPVCAGSGNDIVAGSRVVHAASLVRSNEAGRDHSARRPFPHGGPVEDLGRIVKPVIVAGHVCVDLTPALETAPAMEPGRLIQVGHLAISAGGCVGNTGPALASLGVPTQLAANAGADQLGRILVGLLAASGADTTGVTCLDGQATSYSIVVDIPGRDRTFWHHVGANSAFDGAGIVDRIKAAAARGADGSRDAILHVGYPTHLPALYGNGGQALVSLVGAARQLGATISIDMAEIDPTAEARAVDWESILARTLPGVDVVKASVDDLAAMMPRHVGAAPIAWGDTLVSLGAAVALVTAGSDGLYVRTAPGARIQDAARPLREASPGWTDRELWVPPLASRVVRTTGAGDAAAAGFVAGLSLDRGPAECAALSAASAAARISARPIGDAYELAASFEPAGDLRPDWSAGRDRVYHGPRDGAG